MSNVNRETGFMLTPKEVRKHLNNLKQLPQCSKAAFWTSLSKLDIFLECIEIAEPIPEHQFKRSDKKKKHSGKEKSK